MSKTGIVAFYNNNPGFGVIDSEDGSEEVIVQHSDLEASGLKTLNIHAKVTYDAVPDGHGRIKAINIKMV